MLSTSACSSLRHVLNSTKHVPRRTCTQTGLPPQRTTVYGRTQWASFFQLSTTARSTAPGRSCLLTGATSGIGYAVLKRLTAEEAPHIRITSRDKIRATQAIERARHEIPHSKSEIEIIELDLGNPDLSSRKVFAAEKDWPAVNTFIHCAGISQMSLTISTTAAARSSILRTNVEGYMQLLADFLKSYHASFSRSKTSSEIHGPSYCAISISSLLATKAGLGTSAYAASKAAMLAYNRAVSLEAGQITRKLPDHAPAFRINTVLPGYIDTPMTSNFSEQTRTNLEDQIPLGRFGHPDEVADAVMFLISNEYAHNCTLNLDGGLSAT